MEEVEILQVQTNKGELTFKPRKRLHLIIFSFHENKQEIHGHLRDETNLVKLLYFQIYFKKYINKS